MLKIKAYFKTIYKRAIIFFVVFGPATITAISDNDAAGVATYSLAGANFGYSMLFVLLVVTVLLAVSQEMGVRVAMIARKGLGDLIRERYGVKISLLVFSCLMIANMGTIIADFSALKTTSVMFNLPVIPVIILITAFSLLLVIKGNYKTNQKIFLLGIILYFSYVLSAFKGHPDWGKAVTNLFLPTGIGFTKAYIFSAIAVLGTTITPWGQFFVNSYVIDKKLNIDKLKYLQFETYWGAFLTNFFSFFMIVATSATLYANKIPLLSGETAALAIRPFAGELASTLFGIGLINAAIMGIVIVSLSTTYAFGEFFGVERSLDAPYERGKTFYGLFVLQLVFAALIVMLPSISLFKIVLYTQSLNGILLPFVFYFLLKFTNNKDILGEHTSSKWLNYFVIVCSIIIICASVFSVLSSFIAF